MKKIVFLFSLCLLLGFGVASQTMTKMDKLVIGMVLVGPKNDHGWSQAHFDGISKAIAKVPGTSLVYIDKANPADRPGTTVSQLAEQLVAQGAKLVIFNSDDMSDEAVKFATANKNIFTIMVSGDQVWKDGKRYQELPNMMNIMGRMEYMKMIAGFAAAMTTKTGKIGFLGPLINDETRRLAAAAYLGARHAWVNYLKKDPKKLEFKVTWIGFWFNIPGVTADPTQVASNFYNSGYDVVISGIDTTEVVTEAVKLNGQGKKVWAIPYDYEDAMQEGKDVALGVPYFNWGPTYLRIAKNLMAGTWQSRWEWNGPDWKNINNPDTSAVGFKKGNLPAAASSAIDKFVAEMAKGLNLWKGPLAFQDGSTYLAVGKVATDQEIWYLPQLLQGMQGESVSK